MALHSLVLQPLFRRPWKHHNNLWNSYISTGHKTGRQLLLATAGMRDASRACSLHMSALLIGAGRGGCHVIMRVGLLMHKARSLLRFYVPLCSMHYCSSQSRYCSRHAGRRAWPSQISLLPIHVFSTQSQHSRKLQNEMGVYLALI